MLVTELLMLLTRIFFVSLVILTTVDYLKHKDRIRRDIALVFLCLTSGMLISLFRSVTGIEAPWLSEISQMGIVAQPYLLLRLVQYFRQIPTLIKRIAVVGLITSWVIVILFPTPLPPTMTLLVVAYFVAINGYAVYAFMKGAFSSGGVTRQRLRFTAIGSGFLMLALFLAGIRVVLPGSQLHITPFVQFLSVLSALAYYLGFAPPRWLRQGWQAAELRSYLLGERKLTSAEILTQLKQAIIQSIDTNRVVIVLWDEDSNALKETPEANALTNYDLKSDGIVKQVWDQQTQLVVYQSTITNHEDLRLMQSLNAESLFVVPLTTTERPLGLLLVFLNNGSLFVEDDLNLLMIFAQQTAIILENNIILEQQRRYAEDLEQKIQLRTSALQRSNDELKQFAYVVSHDLQEPLRMISNYMHLIKQRYADKLDQDAEEFIAFAVDGAVRMKQLIDDLLVYSRVETTQQNFTLVDCQQVMDEVCQLLMMSIEESKAVITVDPLPKVMGDERQLVQLFQNLVANGIKYQKDTTPQIHVAATREQDKWVFSVQDNGIGIEPQYADRVFVIFQRLHSRNEYPGTGIGLAICKKVVGHHNGEIWVESKVGQGSTFYFSIPA